MAQSIATIPRTGHAVKSICPALVSRQHRPASEAEFDEIGAKLNQHGLSFCHHNHDHEFQHVLQAGVESGVDWYIVKQDRPSDLPSMESIRVSFENLKRAAEEL